MWGADDPTNRQPMVWRDLEPYEARRGVLRRGALRRLPGARPCAAPTSLCGCGSFRTTVIADDAQDLWVFERVHDGETVLVAVTPSEAGARFELPEPPAGTRWVSCSAAGITAPRSPACSDAAGRRGRRAAVPPGRANFRRTAGECGVGPPILAHSRSHADPRPRDGGVPASVRGPAAARRAARPPRDRRPRAGAGALARLARERQDGSVADAARGADRTGQLPYASSSAFAAEPLLTSPSSCCATRAPARGRRHQGAEGTADGQRALRTRAAVQGGAARHRLRGVARGQGRPRGGDR